MKEKGLGKDDVLEGSPKKKAGSKQTKEIPSEWTSVHCRLRLAYFDKLKTIALKERKTIKDVLDEALEKYLGKKDVKNLWE